MSKSMSSLIPVILSGGTGSRLWPLSRKLYPKQFIPLEGDKSLYQSTLERIAGLEGVGDIITICNDEHRFMAAEQARLSNMNNSDIILEPLGRNTAPAITIAAFHALNQQPDAYLLVLPADHILGEQEQFSLAVTQAYQAAENNLVAFGVVPSRVETGYGYIKHAQNEVSDRAFPVLEFVEKPEYKTAEKYIESGNYLWNSGMFLFRAELFLQEIKQYDPEMYKACQQAVEKGEKDLDFTRLDETSFSKAPSISVDYAVMEKTTKAVVVPLESGWSDVGSWHALWDSFEHDQNNNATFGDVVEEDCNGCFIHANHRLVATVGIKDLVVVETADAVLVAPHNRSQDVKKIVNKLKQAQRDEVDIHPKVYRPWGAYETIDIEDRFQVKRITVSPKQKLSLQSHHHRAEHWIIVKGTARVTRGEKEFLLSENESTYIPIGTKHRLENPGKIPLELIEVQSGTYLGEDDIERYDDVYGR
ncbi:MAG: mannose-1-phosphate guanylyltransferase/mannose-6-phosphate isomerase [Gammaproteobacteria bacterium]